MDCRRLLSMEKCEALSAITAILYYHIQIPFFLVPVPLPVPARALFPLLQARSVAESRASACQSPPSVAIAVHELVPLWEETKL